MESIPEYDGGVAAEILAKHIRSQQPESQQICVILSAILEVLTAEGMDPSSTALFAATMSSLEKRETQSSAQVGVTRLYGSRMAVSQQQR